jgi:5'-3' exonuclease
MSEYEQLPTEFQQCLKRMLPRYLDCANLTMEEAEFLGEFLAKIQRDCNFFLGDLARYGEFRWPETYHQIFPEWVSPGLLARTAGVCRAYPSEGERQHEATYSQFMQNAGKPDRQKQLAAIVEQGLTTDESRKPQVQKSGDRARWLLAIDVNYHLTRKWSAGEGVEAAKNTAEWIERTVNRLKEMGLTDVACCLDSPNSFRKKLTEGWEKQYKERATKDREHVQQLILVEQMLQNLGFCCAKIDTFEADDLLASYAKQFDGKVTLLTVDKDMRQCLSSKCNMLPDIVWEKNEFSGESEATYPWITAKQHNKDGCTYIGTHVDGIPPERWAEFQTLSGDSGDSVDGAIGIGPKIANQLFAEFVTIEAAIQAAKDESELIRPKIRASLIEFESRLEVTRQLVTLRDDLNVPTNTRS